MKKFNGTTRFCVPIPNFFYCMVCNLGFRRTCVAQDTSHAHKKKRLFSFTMWIIIFFVLLLNAEIANSEADIAFFAGRCHKDTRQWLFDDFDKWFSDPGDSRAYVLLGDAGVGKSVIAGVLAQRMKKARRLGAAYFCRHYDGTRNDPRNLLGTVACQLCNCNRQYSKTMGGEDGVRMMIGNSNLGVQELCTKLLEEPLSQCSPFQRKLVIIDALDETEYKSRKDFICLIKERFPRLPEWLVFFITSRPEDLLQSRLAKYNPCVRICAGNGEQRTLCYQQHEQDIQRFLEESVNFSRLPCSVQDVTRRCNGLFLYAFYIAQELNVSLNSGMIDQFCDLFPGDIEDFFETNLKRVYDKVGADLYRKLLGCIVIAPSPLPVSFVSFVLHRENSSLNEQKVIDAVSQFVVMQKRVSFLHSLIPAWLTNKKKAQELYIDEKEAGGYLIEIVKQILSAFLGETRLHLELVERDLQIFSLRFAVHMLCQHAEKDSFELVFRCLTSYRFLEERISSGRFGIYHLLKDFERAASCLAVEQREKQTILQQISSAIESDVHVLVESPHLLPSCIRNASDVVQENIFIPQVSSPWFDLDVYDCPHTVEVLPSCYCFATTSDKQTVAGAKGCLLFLFNASAPHVVSGPFNISEDAIAHIKHLQFSADDKFIFFGRLDKWFSVERETVEDFPQFSGNLSRYEWSVLTPNGCYIVVELNECHSIRVCNNCCLTELVALWARKEIEQSRAKERTCSFGQLSELIANVRVMGRHTRYLMECLNVDQESYQASVMLIPKDTSCYGCGKLKELAESNQEISLATVRQLIIEFYSRLFRYQIWNLQSGQPLLHEVFNQDAQLNSFAYFCHVANAFDGEERLAQCSGVDKAFSVCNIAVVTAVDRFLEATELYPIDDPYFCHVANAFDGQERLAQCFGVDKAVSVCSIAVVTAVDRFSEATELYPIDEPCFPRPLLKSDRIGWFPLSEFDEALLCASLKSDFLEHLPVGFLDLCGEQVSICLSPKREWMVKCTSRLGEIQLLKTRIQEENSGNYSSSKKKHRMTNIASFTFTNDDSLFVYSADTSGGLHALSLQTGAVYTSVSGCNLVYFRKEKQVGYLLRCGVEERAIFLTKLFSPFKFLPRNDQRSAFFLRNLSSSLFLTNFSSSFKLFRWLPEQKDNLAKCIAARFRSTRDVTCISSDSIVTSWKFKNDGYVTAFQFTSAFRLSGFPHRHAHQVTKKYVLSPDGKVIALLQQTKITLHFVESERFCCTVFEAEFDIMDACLKFSADSSLLFVCIQDSLKGPHFYVWDIRKKAMSDSFKSPGLLLTVDCFCISSDMSYFILCGDEDNEIEIREFKKHPFRLLERMGVEKFYNSVKFSLCIVSQDNELLVCCIANLIYVYKLTVANIYSSRQILRGHLGEIEFCGFLKGNLFLISYGVDGMVFLWNTMESKAIGFLRIAHAEGEKIVSMAVSPEEDRAVCFLSSGRVCVITLGKLECALCSKLQTTLTEGKLDAPETKTQLAKQMPSTPNIPTSSLEDLEEDFYIPENYFFDSDESD